LVSLPISPLSWVAVTGLSADCLGMVPLLNGSSNGPMLDLESTKSLSVLKADLAMAVARRAPPGYRLCSRNVVAAAVRGVWATPAVQVEI
jgi:hypothetical protein